MNDSGVAQLARKAAEVAQDWSAAVEPIPHGLEPLGRALLVEPYEPKARGGGVVIIPQSVLENERALDVRVRVVAVGPVCWPDEPPRCKPGDIVLVAKMSGFVTKGEDGKSYRFVNDRDVFARITPRGANHV